MNMLTQYIDTAIWKKGQAKQALDPTHYLPLANAHIQTWALGKYICGIV
jgi:hypothetical protein